jgi:ketosteroid isomerase-like protein
MPARSKPDIVRSLFAAYKAKDREIVEDLLTDDFTFTSPYDDAIDKATYFERCWPTSASDHIQTHTFERIREDGDAVFVLYKCVLNDGREFRNTELFTFDGDRIRKIEVYFGAAYKDGAFVRQ